MDALPQLGTAPLSWPRPPGAAPTWVAEVGAPRPSPSARTVTSLASWFMSWAMSLASGTSTRGPTGTAMSLLYARTYSQVHTSQGLDPILGLRSCLGVGLTQVLDMGVRLSSQKPVLLVSGLDYRQLVPGYPHRLTCSLSPALALCYFCSPPSWPCESLSFLLICGLLTLPSASSPVFSAGKDSSIDVPVPFLLYFPYTFRGADPPR